MTSQRLDTAVYELRSAYTIDEFKDIAKNILQYCDGQDFIQAVVNAAYNLRNNEFFNNKIGVERLIKTILQVRKGLEIVKPDKKHLYLTLAFRKRNPKLKVSPEWRK